MPRTRPIRSRLGAPTAALTLLLACALALPSPAGAAALEPGAEGPRVEALQRAFGVEVDGVFGDALRRAVMRLQRAFGLQADGSVGPKTWGLLVRIRARARQRARAHAPAPTAAARPPQRARATRPNSRRPARRDRAHSARGEIVLPGRPRSGTLGTGWGAALVTGLRAGSSRAVGGRVALRDLRAGGSRAVGGRVARRDRRIGRKVAVQGRPAIAVDLPLRMGVASAYARAKRRHVRPALPLRVRRVIAAGDRIATMPYRYGGGHGNWNDSGYDCSGSISYALHGGGLLDVALASGGFMSWGEPGPGRWISVYANAGHAFMVVAGRRFDTSGRGQTGSRWQGAPRAASGYIVRHPAGL